MKYLNKLKYKFVKLIYADHNKSRSVRRAVEKCFGELKKGDIGLNVGAGQTSLHSQIRNLDIFDDGHIHYVGSVEDIPEEDNFFKIVITQEVLEHVANPTKAVSEIYRVLQTDGLLYCQLPFIIGYHPGPNDYWRFTKEGIVTLVERAGFTIEKIGISVGGGTGFYRILVEFLAVLFSILLPFLYKPLKAFFALVLFPLKWFDYVFEFSSQKDRIAGGYYLLARKI